MSEGKSCFKASKKIQTFSASDDNYRALVFIDHEVHPEM